MASIKPNFPLRFPYKRSVGPVIGAFLAGLRDQKVIGAKTPSGRVLVPPLEYEPETGEAIRELVEVATTGTVTGCTRSDEPREGRPAGWALVQLDGADSAFLHALDGEAEPGTRVRIRWAPERTGHIRDIECFEPFSPGEEASGKEASGKEASGKDAKGEDTVTFMSQETAVDYLMRGTPTQARYGEQMSRHKITGHKCPECDFVYVPPRGYCPLCVVMTGDEHEVTVEPRGTVTSFTVVDPSQYPGGGEKETYVVASILLDGASVTIGQQRVSEIAPEDVHTGLRVEAEWASGDASGNAGMMGSSIAYWAPNNEPDVPFEELKGHVL